MRYLALARKWRPRTFSQLVGQEHVTDALINSLNQQRLHHAYLFTGTRGVGKTSVARLLAKALNCEQGISSEPCLQCETCLAIEQNRFMDLIEVDAASKTRVEDTRELLDNVQYATAGGRFKIYLIDEVHMLSQHSFNALLKTLEEPPVHVKFLLATTDPHKLPVTILSRCLQFNLKNLSLDTIKQQLQWIAEKENKPCEPEVFTLLAKAAQGSMRDGLSLFDQVLASSETVLSASHVKKVLGYSRQDYAVELIAALVLPDAPCVIRICRDIAREGGQFSYVLNEMLYVLHEVLLCHYLPGSHPLLVSSEPIQKLAACLSSEDAQLFYQIALKGNQDMQLAPTLSMGFEMTLLRMLAFKPAAKCDSGIALTGDLTVVPSPQASASSEAVSFSSAQHLPSNQPSERHVDSVSLSVISPPAAISVQTPCWEAIVSEISLSGIAKTAANNLEFIEKTPGAVLFGVEKGHQSLFTPSVKQRIEEALSQYYGEKIRITLQLSATVSASPAVKMQQHQKIQRESADKSLEDDAVFQQVKQVFSAELIKNSII